MGRTRAEAIATTSIASNSIVSGVAEPLRASASLAIPTPKLPIAIARTLISRIVEARDQPAAWGEPGSRRRWSSCVERVTATHGEPSHPPSGTAVAEANARVLAHLVAGFDDENSWRRGIWLRTGVAGSKLCGVRVICRTRITRVLRVLAQRAREEQGSRSPTHCSVQGVGQTARILRGPF